MVSGIIQNLKIYYINVVTTRTSDFSGRFPRYKKNERAASSSGFHEISTTGHAVASEGINIFNLLFCFVI